MVFGKVITQRFGLKDTDYGIILICLKDLEQKIIIKQLLDSQVYDLTGKAFLWEFLMKTYGGVHHSGTVS